MHSKLAGGWDEPSLRPAQEARMASKKSYWRRDCDKTKSRPSGCPKDNETQPVVGMTSRCLAAPTGRKPERAPNFFCARPRSLHFGIA